MVGIQPNTTLIGRLRIKSRSSDPLAEQQRLARMLRSATLHPLGLPESAMLVVRRLTDPLPSRLRAGAHDLVPDASWQRAVAGALEQLAGSAARPAYGAVPADTNAVLFYDRAEVLSSLALDWMSGTLPVQWWWRELLRGRDAITALIREWIEAPQYVPGALDLLAQRKHAVKFVQRLPQHAVTEMLDAVVRTHDVPRPRTSDVLPLVSSAPGERAAPMPYSPKGPSRRQSIALPASSLHWVPEAATPGLSPVHKKFLVQALMLRRAPAVARTVTFQNELLLWEAISDRVDEIEVREAASDEPGLPRESRRKDSAEVVMPRQADAVREEAGLEPASFRADDAERISPELTGIEREAEIQGEDIDRPMRGRFDSDWQTVMTSERDSSVTEASAPQAIEEHGIISAPVPVEEPAAPAEEPHAKPTPEPSTTFETEYGGVFFLLGLALYLYIYGDFTSPAKPGLELNIWDFLALMGSEITGGEIEKDPLWDQLALLAGRPKWVRPGLDFDPPDEWRLPEEWIKPFPQAYDAQPVLANGRLIARHPAGFIILDLPANADAGDKEEALAPVNRLERWVGWMVSYFRARLVRALGRDDGVTLVCGRPATVVLTVTHVDLTFSLEHHPIELRMAGLDRDLGWIPAAGRYVAFHFR
jgi:hypothetical protein